MAAYWTNRGKARLLAAGTTGRTFVLVLVQTGGAPATAAVAADLDEYSQVTNEANFTNYTTKVLTSVTATEVTGTGATLLTPTPTSFVYTAAGGAVNNTIIGGWLVERVGGTLAATDHLWCWLGMTSITTNGGDLTVNFASNGISTVT